MASATASWSLVDGKTARSAVTKSAKFLRSLLAAGHNREQFILRGLLPKEVSAGSEIKVLQKTLFEKPELFHSLLAVVSELPDGSEAATRLTEASRVSDGVQSKPCLSELRTELKTIKDFGTTQENTALCKGAINKAIANALKETTDVKVIKQELCNLQKERLMSPSILEWALPKIEEQIKAISLSGSMTYPLEQCTPLSLESKYLDDASLCSVVVNKHDTESCIKLFRTLSEVALTKVTISHYEERISFPKCMIANVNDLFIVAFESHFDFEIWNKLTKEVPKCTFGKGLELLIERFPTLYFEALIREKKTVILTGFSFGGVLAHMLAAKLWQLPQLDSNQLHSNLLCITFGEPLVQSLLLTNVAEVFPDFKANIHAIFHDQDHAPYLIEHLDSIVCSGEEQLQVILSDLLCMQKCVDMIDGKHSLHASSSSTLKHPSSAKSQPLTTLNEVEADTHLHKLLQKLRNRLSSGSQSSLSVLTATTYNMIMQHDDFTTKSDIVTFDQAKRSREMSISNVTISTLTQHRAGGYQRFVRRYISVIRQPGKHRQVLQPVTTTDFLTPIVEKIQVTQYGDEATIVVRGKQLWFTHSLKIVSIVKQPFQKQENSASFCVNIGEIKELLVINSELKKEISLFSYFAPPINKKILVEVNANHLSPRGQQLARLEPAHLIELAFTMALLEKQQNRLDGLSIKESSPLFHHIQSFLHDIATATPYESILCAIAYSKHKAAVDQCTSLLKEHDIGFPPSLLATTSHIVAVSRSGGIIMDKNIPVEDSAYFSWMSQRLLTDKYAPIMNELFGDDGDEMQIRRLPKYIKMLLVAMGACSMTVDVLEKQPVNDSLKYLCELDVMDIIFSGKQFDIPAVCELSAVDLYAILKSPITILSEGRKKLAEISDSDSNKGNVISVLDDARGEQFNSCISVLCGFMYQQIRIPFTEENPVTLWKALRVFIGPVWDGVIRQMTDKDEEFDIEKIKFDQNNMVSIAKKCKRFVQKGTEVAECMYDGKLRFLVSNIDKSALAEIIPSSSDYVIHALEQKLIELCSKRNITTLTSIEDLTKKWQDYFYGCPLLHVAHSHHSLIAQWIKWSLMVSQLRLTLEKYTTITVSGLVNSGKSQLMRTLFGLDVKTGTTDARRTTVPFIYCLDPDVEGVNVIDFPGVDDNDQDVIKPVEFLKFVSQIVIFVIHYTKTHTLAAKQWLQRFEVTEGGSEEELQLMQDNPHSAVSFAHSTPRQNKGSKVPVLVCLTFADRLLARDFMNDSGDYGRGEAKKGIAKHFEDITRKIYNQGVNNPVDRRTIGYYCFRLDKRTKLTEDDMKMVGIGTPMDVGDWICNQIKHELHMPDTANRLQEYFKQSYKNLKF